MSRSTPGVRKRPSGKWEWSLRYEGVLHTKGGFDTQREAKEARDEARVALRTGTYGVKPAEPAPVLNVGAYLDRWLDYLRHAGKHQPTTIAAYEQKSNHLRRLLGDRPLDSIKRGDITTLGTTLTSEGLSAASVRGVLVTCTQLFDHALDDELIVVNPAHRPRKPSVPPSPGVVLTIDEIARVKEAAKGTLWEAAVWLALHTGARRSEVLALTWADVDLDAGLVTYSKAVTAVGNQRHERTGTKNSTMRVSSIGPDVVSMLRAYRAEQVGRRLRGRTWGDNDLVVVSRNGSAPRPRSLSQGWQTIAQNAGVRARFHDLRHTHVTGLLRAGVTLTETARSVGHSSPATTAKVYAHVIDQLEPGSNLDFLGGLSSRQA